MDAIQLTLLEILKILVAGNEWWEWEDGDSGRGLDAFFASEQCPAFLGELRFDEELGLELSQRYSLIHGDYRFPFIHPLEELEIDGQVTYTSAKKAFLVERGA